MPDTKYIASGFVSDATKLLEDFFEKKSLEFSAFAEVWCKRSFFLIYKYRDNDRELIEFTHEIFRLSGKFLFSSRLCKQVGAIFLLYALYRNQISDPPIMIRITLEQFQILKFVLAKAQEERLKSLQYVINYLFENKSLELVALPTLMGPNMHRARMLNEEQQCLIRKLNASVDAAQILELADLGKMFTRYADLRKNRQWSDVSGQCDEFIRKLDESNNIVPKKSNAKDKSATKSSVGASPVGSRRVQLKAAQFSRAIEPWMNTNNLNKETDTADYCSDEDVADEPTAKQSEKVKLFRRDSGVKVNFEDDESGDSVKLVKKRTKRVRTRNIRCYYNEGSESDDTVCPTTEDLLKESSSEKEMSLPEYLGSDNDHKSSKLKSSNDTNQSEDEINTDLNDSLDLYF